MNDKKGKIKNSKRGMVLVLAVVIILILAIIGIGLLQLGRNARLQAVKDVLQISARSAADAGIEHAVRHMINLWNSDTNKSAWIASWNDPAKLTLWDEPNNLVFGPVSLGSSTFGNARFKYSIYKGTRPKGYGITSTGTAAGVTRTVHAAVILKSIYDSNVFSAIAAKKSIYISPGEDFGTVPDGDAISIQTNSTSSDPPAITLKPGTYIPGDIIIGPGGDPDVSIDYAPNVTITGEDVAAEEYMEFTPVYPPALTAGSWTVDPNDPTKAYISSDVQLAGLTLGSGINKLYIEGNPAVNGGNVKVYVAGFTYLPSGTQLIVVEDSSLTLYLGGNMDVKPGAVITYSNIADDPAPSDEYIIEAVSNISIKGTVTQDGTPLCTDVQFFPNGNFYGTINTPDADPLYIAPNGDFYGGIIGDSIVLKPGGSFFSTVPSFRDETSYEDLYMGVKMGSWWE